MKNLRPVKLKNFLGGVAFGLLLVSILFSTVGCSKNKSASINRGYGWQGPGGFSGQPGFPNQPGYSYGPLGVGYDWDGNEVYLEFGLPLGANYQDPYFFTGQVMVTGAINMVGLTCLGGGYVPGGQYQMYALQPSMAQNGMVSGVQLIAQGPVELMLTVSWAHIESPSVVSPNFDQVMGLTAMMNVQTMNGYPCNASLGVSPGGY